MNLISNDDLMTDKLLSCFWASIEVCCIRVSNGSSDAHVIQRATSIAFSFSDNLLLCELQYSVGVFCKLYDFRLFTLPFNKLCRRDLSPDYFFSESILIALF